MMAPLWWAMAALIVLALAFFLWPLRRKGTSSRLERVRRQYLEANVALFREHLAELEASRDAGRLSAEAFEQLKHEQERALLEEERELGHSKPVRGKPLPGGWMVIGAAVLALVGSLGFYHWQGASDDVQLAQMRAEKARLDRQERMSDERVDPSRTWALIEQLKERLDEEPESRQHRFLLARYFRELGHFDQAIEAYEAILKFDNDPQIRAELAETLFIRNNNRVTDRVRELVRGALAANPEQTTALGLAGIDAYSRGNYREAISHWERAVAAMNPNSGNAAAFQRGIERARAALEEAPEDQSQGESEEGPTLPVTVRLAEEAEAEPDQWVFVYARQWEGPPMPLAITRLRAKQLPKSIILDETMAMSPSASLSGAEEVELVARLSRDGDATPKPGDWQGTLGPVSVSDPPESMELMIDKPIAE